MTAEQFAYWMQGFAELTPTPPTPEQWQSIREHVAAVFKKVTPPVGVKPTDLQKVLDEVVQKPAPYPFQPWGAPPIERHWLQDNKVVPVALMC